MIANSIYSIPELTTQDKEFLYSVAKQLARSRAESPGNDALHLSLVAGAGAVSTSCVEHSWTKVAESCIDLAVASLRLSVEGDVGLAPYRERKGLLMPEMSSYWARIGKVDQLAKDLEDRFKRDALAVLSDVVEKQQLVVLNEFLGLFIDETPVVNYIGDDIERMKLIARVSRRAGYVLPEYGPRKGEFVERTSVVYPLRFHQTVGEMLSQGSPSESAIDDLYSLLASRLVEIDSLTELG